MNTLIDTHAHYHNPRFDDDRDLVLQALPSHGITTVINVGYDLDSSQASVQLAEAYDFCYAAVGVHPHDAETVDDAALQRLAALAKHPKVVAIGEIGLDYFRDLSPRDKQAEAFCAQLTLARTVKLPVIVHDRDAHADCLTIAAEYPDVPIVFHCYAGSAEMARELVKRGRMLSFTPNITYPKPKRAHESALAVGLEHIMIETDCPYMAPQSHRGQRNDSRLLPDSVAVLAQWFGVSEQEVASITTANARRFFNLP